MSVTPPDKIPTWATSGVVTDPGSAKQATGWEDAEAPAADIMNWVLRLLGESAQFNTFNGQSDAALWNLESDTLTGSFTSGFTTSRIYLDYHETAARYYTVKSDAGNNYRGWESSDGLNWGSSTLIASSLADPINVAQTAFRGTTVCCAAADSFYLSTSNSLANLGAAETFSNILRVRGLVYDAANDTFIACGGQDGPDAGAVEVRGAVPGWTLRSVLGPQPFTKVATSTAGTTIVVSEGSTTAARSTDAFNFVQITLPAIFTNLIRSRGIGAFVGTTNAGRVYFSDTGETATWTDTGINIASGMLVDTPDMLFGLDQVSGEVYVWRNVGAAHTTWLLAKPGFVGPDLYSDPAYTAGSTHSMCGPGKVIWIQGADGILSQYGPSV